MSRCGALVAGLLCLLGAALVRAEDVISQWDAAFPTRDAPPQVYFRAGYHDDVGRTHRLENLPDQRQVAKQARSAIALDDFFRRTTEVEIDQVKTEILDQARRVA